MKLMWASGFKAGLVLKAYYAQNKAGEGWQWNSQ